MISKFKFKRGNMIIDSLFFIIILFVFVLILFSGKIISNEINADIQSNNDLSTTGKAISQDIDDNYGSLFDSAIIMAFILFWILTIAFSFLIDSSPIFFIVSFVLLIGVLVVAAYIGNMYEEIVDDPSLSSVSNDFPMTNFIFSNILGFVIIVSLSIGVALYAKTRT